MQGINACNSTPIVPENTYSPSKWAPRWQQQHPILLVGVQKLIKIGYIYPRYNINMIPMPMPNLMSKLILVRRPEFGGTTTLGMGRVGVGKTSLLCEMGCKILNDFDDIVFWRGQPSCQWTKFLDYNEPVPVKLLIPKNKTFAVGEKNPEHIIGDPNSPPPFKPVPNYDLPPTDTFSGWNDLLKKSDPHSMNVIYINKEELIDLLKFTQNNIFDWTTFFIDECEELARWGSSGEEWKNAVIMGDILKEARKYRMSIYTSTQGTSDIYWFVRDKFMSYAFLAGAGAIRNTPVDRRALNSLREGEAWLTSGTNYERIKIYPWVSRRDWRMRVEDGSGVGGVVKELLREPT